MQDMERFVTGTNPGSGDERLWRGSVNPSCICGIRLGLGIALSWEVLELKVLELKVWSLFQMKAVSGGTTLAGFFKGR